MKKKTRNDIEKLCEDYTFGAFVAIVRAEDGITQKILAQRAKISVSTLSRIENGHSHILDNAIKAIRIGRALGYSEEFFLKSALEDHLESFGIYWTVEVRRLKGKHRRKK